MEMGTKTAIIKIQDEPYLGCGDFEHGWRGFHLSTYGETLESLINNALVVELDRDGESYDGTSIFDYDSDVLVSALAIIVDRYNKARGTSFQIEDLNEHLSE